ncbi:MAG: hypothetical protein BWX80_03860 [Candidatus Hydrogenedentes bacterium ADurb.Bin101]|nr:MAG: hypothetical protein BWX80_03860 [Candidatus Hydrogenedentes bacterium ADurb.Bin101]
MPLNQFFFHRIIFPVNKALCLFRGQGENAFFDKFLHGLIAQQIHKLGARVFRDTFAYAFPQFLQSFLAGFPGEFIIHFGQHAALDLIDLDLIVRGFSGKFLRLIIFREGHVRLHGITTFRATQNSFHILMEPLGTQNIGVIFSAVARERLPVYGAAKIHDNLVAVPGAFVHQRFIPAEA